MKNSVYSEVLKFKKKYKGTIAFRLKRHSEILEKHLNPGEKVLYAFAGQKNSYAIALPNTFVVAVTNQRLLFARKRLFFGSFFYSITPDLFNDLKANTGLLWGRVIIDTIKEVAIINNLSKKSLDEVETEITQHLMKEKKKYHHREDSK